MTLPIIGSTDPRVQAAAIAMPVARDLIIASLAVLTLTTYVNVYYDIPAFSYRAFQLSGPGLIGGIVFSIGAFMMAKFGESLFESRSGRN